MTVILTLLHFATSPEAIPLWGALSFFLLHLFNLWNNERKLKVENKKNALTESQGNRQQDREDFVAIKNTLYSELERVKSIQVETTRQLEESNEETKKCEQRYFELATQYRELLKYCANLAKEVRELKSKVQAHVSKEDKLNNDENRTDRKDQGSSGE